MRKLILMLAILAAPAVMGQAWWEYKPEMAKYPLRAQGTNRVNLAPLFGWFTVIWKTPVRDFSAYSTSRPPMPQWKPVCLRVERILEAGILGTQFRESPPFARDHRTTWAELVLIKNYPSDKLAEGDKLRLVALDAGVEKLTTTKGQKRRIKAYDGGLPFAAKKRDEKTSPEKVERDLNAKK